MWSAMKATSIETNRTSSRMAVQLPSTGRARLTQQAERGRHAARADAGRRSFTLALPSVCRRVIPLASGRRRPEPILGQIP